MLSTVRCAIFQPNVSKPMGEFSSNPCRAVRHGLQIPLVYKKYYIKPETESQAKTKTKKIFEKHEKRWRRTIDKQMFVLYNISTLNGTTVPHSKKGDADMRTKNQDLLSRIQEYIETYCDKHGRGPSIRDIADEIEISSTNTHRYIQTLLEEGRIARGRNGYESNVLAKTEKSMTSVAILGAVPCGPLTEVESYIEGYIRLPESLIGQGRFYILKASGDSMINAGIDDGDLVLIRQQETASVGDIVVALVENENTLKRLEFNERENRYYLHPENKTMDDIYVDEIRVQGVAVKVLKDLK